MKISVIIPVYNAARHLKATLDALAAQTFRDFEVIAVDDGSTDGCLAPGAECLVPGALNLPGLRVIRQANAGQGPARNRGLDEARGEYVYMMDADDLLAPEALELMWKAAEGGGYDFVCCDARSLGEGETMAPTAVGGGAPGTSGGGAPGASGGGAPEQLPVPALPWFMASGLQPAIWQFLFRRETLAAHRFIRERVVYEDGLFLYTYLAQNRRGVHLPLALYGYVQRAGSCMHALDYARRLESTEVVLAALKRELSAADYALVFRTLFAMRVKTLYRDAHGAAFRDFVRRGLASGTLPGTLPFRWRLRLMLVKWGVL